MSAPNPRFREEERHFTGRYSDSVLNTLGLAYLRHLPIILFYLVLGLVSRLLIFSNTNLIGYWVDSYCREPQPCRPVPAMLEGFTADQYLGLMAAVTAFGFVLTLVYRAGLARTSARAVSRLYDEVTLRTSRLPQSFFDSTPAGRIITRFSSDYNNAFRFFGGPLTEFIGVVFDLIAAFILISVASPYFIPLFALAAGLNYLIYRRNREGLRASRRELSRLRSPSIAHFAETTQGTSTIRAFSMQGTFFTRFRRLDADFLSARIGMFRRLYGFSFQMNCVYALFLTGTGLAGYALAETGAVSVGSVGAAFAFVTFSGFTLQLFFEWIAQFEEGMTAIERLDEYLRRDLEPGAFLPSASTFQTPHPKREPDDDAKLAGLGPFAGRSAAIEARGLWFRYRDELPWVLKDVSFAIRPGEHVGIVGRTGSGKTSLIQALFRLYPISRGEIRIRGLRPEQDCDLEQYRRAIALISQEPVILRGTLRENLALRADASDEQMRDALERVGLGAWLTALPRRLDSQIEERGRNLSQGERQLLCMARCLLQSAPVVVMDEATSSVDPQSEEIMVRATREFFAERTQLIIAHRLSTLRACDRILWLDQGELKMQGTPAEVLPEFEKRR